MSNAALHQFVREAVQREKTSLDGIALPEGRIFSAKARGRGDVVSNKGFTEGRFEPPGLVDKLTLSTTMLTDVVTSCWGRCKALDPHAVRTVVVPSSRTRTNFLLSFACAGGTLYVERRIDNTRPFLANPLASELPGSYRVTIWADVEDSPRADALLEIAREACA